MAAESMLLSAAYICPVRGLASLEAPEPDILGRTAGIARGLGLNRLHIPVLEESLLRADRHRVRFLDELIRGLDQVADSSMAVWLMAPAQRILGMDWVAPYLVKGSLDSKAVPVFVDGNLRPLRPFAWWSDPSVVQRRLACLRELVAAVSGHPALTGWIIMDRVLEWPRPAYPTADLLLKSYCAEIRERDETGDICLSLGVSEFRGPEMAWRLGGQVGSIYLKGIDDRLEGWPPYRDLGEEVRLAAYLYSLADWLLEKEITLEIGWSMMGDTEIGEDMLEAVSILGRQAVNGVTWLHLIEPEKRLLQQPPWRMRPGLDKVALLDLNGDPKEGVESLIREMLSSPQHSSISDFIDIERDEYLDNPHVHFRRLWNHFREAF